MSPAGYSGTPQARKLGIKPGQRVALDAPPEGWALTGPLPELAAGDHTESADLIVAFFTTAQDLVARLPHLAERIYPAGILWIAWPRRAAGHVSDLTDVIVRARVLELGLVDTKIAAIDDDWSGQKAVWRVINRTTPSPPPRNARFLVDVPVPRRRQPPDPRSR
ncbi:DUF3052 domain-containing protein [Pengzhenrongella sp.]|jgi:hypothetical protein|uniref:DUF3052 domain-containing protein n=1 Tax=Pengzhenrongella sp. TaxID=2888820 RepID=UPI002F922808